MSITRFAGDGGGPLYQYSVATVSDLLLALKPHVLRAIRSDLMEHEPEFDEAHRAGCSELIQHIDEMLVGLDGEA